LHLQAERAWYSSRNPSVEIRDGTNYVGMCVMRGSILVIVGATLLFGGCTRIERETVVEKPVVQKETVVEKPVPSGEVVVERVPAAPRGCTFSDRDYSHGAMSCQENSEFRCDDGIWRSQGRMC
jgi:hypothetical protein